MVDRLSNDGLVDRRASREDRRVNQISLTAKVWRALAEHYSPAGRRVLQATETLTTEEVTQLTEHIQDPARAVNPSSNETQTP
jgi:DNA-binding MarR family transcriptional regulator